MAAEVPTGLALEVGAVAPEAAAPANRPSPPIGVASPLDPEVRGAGILRRGERAFLVLDRLLARALPEEWNPFLQTGAIAAWGSELIDHPFDLLYQLGFAVTVNVDNRTMSGTSLTRELGLLAETFGYDLADIEAFQLNAAAATFLTVEEREELVEIIAEGFEEA